MPIPKGEFEQTELLAMEKESIGIFISAHPLKQLSIAMSAKTDVTLGEIANSRDGERVVVGGIISQVKRLRTKKGDPMVFATLEDLSGSVELVIFSDTLEECAEAVQQDAVVLVKGKLDHKDAARTCVVVSTVELFAPSEEELVQAEKQASQIVTPGALCIKLDAAAVLSDVIDDLRELLVSYPGESDVVVELTAPDSRRRLRLGADYRVARGAGLHSELAQLLGSALLPVEAEAA